MRRTQYSCNISGCFEDGFIPVDDFGNLCAEHAYQYGDDEMKESLEDSGYIYITNER